MVAAGWALLSDPQPSWEAFVIGGSLPGALSRPASSTNCEEKWSAGKWCLSPVVCLLAPAFTFLIIPKEADVVNAVLSFSPHPATSIPALLCLYLLSPLSLPSAWRKIPARACQSVMEVSSSPHAKRHYPAPPWLCPEHQSVSVKTLTALLPARRASDPICTANSLPGLFCLSLPNTCYLNSKSFFWGLTVSLLFLEFTHYFNSATLFVCSRNCIYTHLCTHTNVYLYTHRCMCRHTTNISPTPSLS